MKIVPDPPPKNGDIVWAGGGPGGLSYRARVEALKGDKALLRPLTYALTASSARSRQKGPSVRARWVTAAWTSPVRDHDSAEGKAP